MRHRAHAVAGPAGTAAPVFASLERSIKASSAEALWATNVASVSATAGIAGPVLAQHLVPSTLAALAPDRTQAAAAKYVHSIITGAVTLI
jgi:hypothetical protein